MADNYVGRAFAELPELSEINRDFEGYVNNWEKKYGGGKQAEQYALKWFEEALADKDETAVEEFSDRELTWGKMFHFEYDPVTADRLAYWDKSPMVISLGRHPNGNILGMNINFLPKTVRYWMVGKVFQVYEGMIIAAAAGKNYRRATAQQQVQIDYETIKRWLGKFGLDFCVRQYHINKMSKLAVICYEDWVRAVMINWNDFHPIQENELKRLYDEYLQKVRKPKKKR